MTAQKPSDKKPSDVFNDKANRKFMRIWRAEAEVADDFEMSVYWYQKWSADRDDYKAKADAEREEACQGMVDFWDLHLVTATVHLAKLKENIESSKDPIALEFVRRKLTALQPLYDALSTLDDEAIKSGKAIFDALKPLIKEKPRSQTKAPMKSPVEKGNPFKKGPG